MLPLRLGASSLRVDYDQASRYLQPSFNSKGWLAIAKLKPLSLFISLLLMLKKALDNGKMVK